MDIEKPKGIIDGFGGDFTRIAQEFSEKHNDLKLTDFFLYWQNNKLDLLFVNRYDPRELYEAISEMNKLLVTKLEHHDNHTEWIVAIYMLLCINVKQPQRQRRCIRVTVDEFILVERNLGKHHADVSFAWKCMKNSKAINLVEDKEEYGPQLLKKGGNKSLSSSDSSSMSNSLELIKEDAKAMIDKQTKLIEEFESIYASYRQVLTSMDIEGTTKHLEEVKECMGRMKDMVE